MKNHDPFGVIRTTVEAEIAAPGILTISSARAGDGKTAVAAGIARSLAAAGYRTLAIDAAGSTEETLCTRLGAPPPPSISVAAGAEHLSAAVRTAFNGCDVLALSDGDGAGPSAVAVAALYAAIRANYDYAVVDTRAIGDGGATFARCADGVVLAVREGRAAEAADGEAVALLERVHARFLGVVATAGPVKIRHSAEGALPVHAGPLPANPFSRLRDFFASTRENHGQAVGSTTPD
jgi:receptor protein-tyrosine kinase